MSPILANFPEWPQSWYSEATQLALLNYSTSDLSPSFQLRPFDLTFPSSRPILAYLVHLETTRASCP